MSFIEWINPFSKVIDVIGEAVEDKDKSNQIRADIERGRLELIRQAEDSYLSELNTRTVPWVDALHKMGRQIMSYLGYGLAFYMVHEGYDPIAAMAAVAPGGLYAYVKGKGR